MNKKAQAWTIILEGGWLLALVLVMIYFWIMGLWGRAILFTIFFISSLIAIVAIESIRRR